VKRAELTEIRNLLTVAVRQFGDKGLSSSEIVAEFKKRHRREIAAVSGALEDIALIKLIAEVSNRRPAATFAPAQGDLFAGYRVPSAVVIPVAGTKETQRKTFPNLTYGELKAWFKDHSRERAANEKLLGEVRRLLDRVKPFMKSDDMTIGEGLVAAEVAAAKKDARR
jgi:hypothetical protein